MLRGTERERIIKLTLEGWSRREVAKIIGCTTQTVMNILKKHQPEALNESKKHRERISGLQNLETRGWQTLP